MSKVHARNRLAVGAVAVAALVAASVMGGLVLPAAAATATLTFSTQPNGGTAAVAWTFQPVVTITSGTGTPTDTITLSITTPPTGAVLTCTGGDSKAAVAGIATFSGCSINKTDATYTLTATDTPSSGTMVSNSFAVTAGTPTQLVFHTQPPGGTAVAGWGMQVYVEDAEGNVTSDNSTMVTMAIGTNAGGGTLTCAPVTASAGVATFSGCSINKAGTGYTLIASATSLASATSSAFNITPGPANQLVFTTQPGPGTNIGVGAAIPVAVAVEDAEGNVETTAQTTVVTLAIQSHTGSGVLTCTSDLTLQASTLNGVATFGGCSDSGAGSVTLDVTSTGPSLGPTDSNGFNIVAAGPESKLAFTTEPGNSLTAGNPLSTQPVVSVEDASGNTTASADSVTLAVASGPGALTCTGGNTAVAAAGVATFTGCSLSVAGAYTLKATDATTGTITAATSTGFTVGGDQLVFAVEPGSASSAGAAFSTQPRVDVENGSGVIASGTGSTDLITLTITPATGTSGAVLTCAAVAAVSGVATFANCSINDVGSGYKLTATDTSEPLAIAAVQSTAFSVGEANVLVFTTQPSGGAISSPFAIQPVVTVENGSGVVVTSGTGSTDTISLSIAAGTGAAGAALTCASVAVVAGVATFANCSINKAGTGYELTATDTTEPAVATVRSSAFNVSATPLPIQIYGVDPIGTSIATSKAEFPTNLSAEAVVLARSDFFSDALAGGPLAAAVDGPMLLTQGASVSTSLNALTQGEIQRVLPTGDTVYVLGGDLALSPSIDTTLVGLGYKVVREAGSNEYATAVDIAQQLGNPSTIFEATGLSFYDALSAVPAAIVDNAAILLTNGSTQAPETATYLAAHTSDRRYAIGGPLAAYGADPTATPVFGQDLFNTSAAVATQFFPEASIFGAATAADFPDALGGGVFMATGGRDGPLLLVNQSIPLPPEITPYLATLALGTQGYVFGGPLAVGAAVLIALQEAVG